MPLSPTLRNRAAVLALCLCPIIWALGCAALCSCPGIYATAAAVSLVPTLLPTTRLTRLLGLLFLIFSVGLFVSEYKTYTREQAAIARIKHLAATRATQPATTAPTTAP